MPKIGGPSLPPQLPRTEPRAPTEPAVPQQPPAPQTPPGAKADQVAQQFGTAFTSAGKLASQLAKGLFTTTPQPRRGPSEKEAPKGGTSSRSRASERPSRRSEAEPEHSGGGGSSASDGPQSPEPGALGDAFAALRRARQDGTKRSRRKRSGKTGDARAVDASHLLEDEGEEDVLHRPSLRTWLRGDEAEESAFDTARREARLLEQMEVQGEPPSRLLSQLNGQLSAERGAQFKSLLSAEVTPQLKRLALRVGEASTEERRQLSALVSRALYQAGAPNVTPFDPLLNSIVDTEAQHLMDIPGLGAERAEELCQALRRAASPTYRAALIDKSRGALETLGRELTTLPAEQLPGVVTCLLRSGEALGGTSATAMAEALVTGLLGTERPEASGAFFVALAPALREVPGAGFWVLQLLLVLGARGEVELAQYLTGLLLLLLREARALCAPDFLALRPFKERAQAAAREQEVWRHLDEAASLCARLMPVCGAIHALRERLPAELADEALRVLGGLDLVSATSPGQQVLRQALLEQERGEWTFLSTLPLLAPTLYQPRILQALLEGGLAPTAYEFGGAPYLKRIALQTSRALSGPLLAWSQKGDLAARRLLRSAVCINASLYGLGPQGAEHAAELLETLRARPQPSQEPRVFQKLLEVARKHPPPTRSGSIEGLRGLVTALAHRDPQAAHRQVLVNPNAEGLGRLSTRELSAVQATLARTQQQQREAAERERQEALRAKTRRPGQPPKPPSGTPGSRR